jgi:hypothetical protein
VQTEGVCALSKKGGKVKVEVEGTGTVGRNEGRVMGGEEGRRCEGRRHASGLADSLPTTSPLTSLLPRRLTVP